MRIVQIFILFLVSGHLLAQKDSARRAQNKIFGESKWSYSLDSILKLKVERKEIIGIWLLDTVNSKKTDKKLNEKTITSLHSNYDIKEIEFAKNKSIKHGLTSEKEDFYWTVSGDTLIWWVKAYSKYARRSFKMLISKVSKDELVLTTPIQNQTVMFRRKK